MQTSRRTVVVAGPLVWPALSVATAVMVYVPVPESISMK